MSLAAFLNEQDDARWPAALPDHLSASSLKGYMRCRESWRRRYLDKHSEQSSHYFVWGAAHNAALVELNYRQKIETHEDRPVAEIQDAFAAAVDEKIENDGGEGEINWGREMSPATVKDQGVKLVAAYMTVAAPTVQPVAVEKKFDVAVPGVPVSVTGYIDVVAEGRTIELKTASKKEVTPADRFQGRVYQYATALPLQFHVATKTKTPAVYMAVDGDDFEIPFSRGRVTTTGRMMENLAADIVATYNRFGPDGPWPGAFAVRSTCNLCGYRKDCPWWAQ